MIEHLTSTNILHTNTYEKRHKQWRYRSYSFKLLICVCYCWLALSRLVDTSSAFAHMNHLINYIITIIIPISTDL